MNGYRIVRYSLEGKPIGLSEWQERQEQLSSTFDRWSKQFRWNCVVVNEGQLSEILEAKK